MNAWIEHCDPDQYEFLAALYFETHHVYPIDDSHVLFVKKSFFFRIIAQIVIWITCYPVNQKVKRLLIKHRKELTNNKIDDNT